MCTYMHIHAPTCTYIHAHVRRQGYVDKAETWYLACHAFHPRQPRCMYLLVSMLDQMREGGRAFTFLQVAGMVIADTHT
jgi:hypothetical protein